ncbi:hypothetical protein [Virgibacillus pantothenticus]|uniref:hypothetical protein n=1 Tax=Virgibacillus pantothenticus TaxID=1473 RepID=UPI001BB082E4|nr:hypothetical protein [Virgibacillus pantothenticus]
MEAVKDGKYIDVHCLVMSLPFSNDAYAIPLPGENQECLFYGMKKIFAQLTGVPIKVYLCLLFKILFFLIFYVSTILSLTHKRKTYVLGKL